MKLLIIGLDCAAPELLFGFEDLVNIRRLMEYGAYGRLESVKPPITVPAWMCMSTSQDPGTLGIYGFRNRSDYSYDGLKVVDAKSIRGVAAWDQVAMEGGRSIVVAVPPSYPPRRLNGINVGCFLTPDADQQVFTHPASLSDEIRQLVGSYPVDVKGFRTDRKDWLRDEIFAMSRKQFQVIRHLMANHEWDYFQFVDIGLDRVHHGFWQYHDKQHVLYEPGNPYENVIPEYYRHLDEEIGSLLELLDEDTAVAVVSDHGAQRLDGGFCVNQWLIEQGLLVLEEYPSTPTPFNKLRVDWSRTRVWSEGGYYARVFFNVKGREPNGVIEPSDYESFRAEMKALLEGGGEGMPPDDTRAYVPDEIYRNVNGIPPDLIVHFGDLYWRSIGSVGYDSLRIQENDTGPDGCNHAQFGAFILGVPGVPPRGEVQGTSLLDIVPTMLTVGGYEVPPTMQGRSLLAYQPASDGSPVTSDIDDESIIRERLSGLGYIA